MEESACPRWDVIGVRSDICPIAFRYGSFSPLLFNETLSDVSDEQSKYWTLTKKTGDDFEKVGTMTVIHPKPIVRDGCENDSGKNSHGILPYYR